MQTQRDHVHAHQFMMGRLSSALVQGDPTSAEIPGARALNGILIGIVVALLGIGGVAVYGWIVPGGSTAYSNPGTMVIEKETGNRYVYLGGELRPVANVTTATMLLGGAMTVKLISRNSIKDVPRGTELGDPRWPQSVSAGIAGPWLLCLPGSRVEQPAPNALGVNIDPTTLTAALPGNRFALVRGPDDKRYLILANHKFQIRQDSTLVALGASNVRATVAPQTWLDQLPDGIAIGPAAIPGAGEDGPEVGGESRQIGTLFRQRQAGGDEQLFVLRRDGLAPMSPTEFLLAVADSGKDPVDVDAADIVAAPRSDDRSLLDRLPDLTATRWQNPGPAVLCQRQGPTGADTLRSEVVFAPPDRSGVDRNGTSRVLGVPGRGMAVVALPRPKGLSVPVTYISESGVAYPVTDPETQRALGLDSAAAVPFPGTLLALLTPGPSLNRGALAGPAGG